MSRPAWATTIGIFVLIIGLIGCFSGVFKLAAPAFSDFQDSLMTEANKAQSESNKNASNELKEKYGLQMETPDSYRTWGPIYGVFQIIISILYFIGGILLLKVKPQAIRIMYAAIGTSIISSIIFILASAKSLSITLMIGMSSHILSILIDVILLVVVLLVNKKAYIPTEPAEIGTV